MEGQWADDEKLQEILETKKDGKKFFAGRSQAKVTRESGT